MAKFAMDSYRKRPKKATHLARNMVELLEKRIKHSCTNFDVLCRVSDTILKKIKEEYGTTPVDEEYLFILCLRYLYLVEQAKIVINDNKFYNARFSRCNAEVNEICVKCELSLVERYNPILRTEQRKKCCINNDEETTIIRIGKLYNNIPLNDVETFIDVHQLYRFILNAQTSKLLIMDIRNYYNQTECPIKFSPAVLIPEKAIRKGLTTNTLEQYLNGDSLTHYRNRYDYDVIILADLDTNKTNFKNSKVEHLRSILIEWDLNADDDKKKPLVLCGGVLAFAEYYPTLVNNSSKLFNTMFQRLDDFMSDAEYPEILNPDQPPEMPAALENEPPQFSPEVKEEVFRLPVELPQAAVGEGNEGSAQDPLALIIHTVTIAVHQLEVEETLLNLTKQKISLMKQYAANKLALNICYEDLKKTTKEISKNESFKIQLDERRKEIGKIFISLKLDENNTAMISNKESIMAADQKRVSIYRNRKKFESDEESTITKFAALIKHGSQEIPTVDRKLKPIETVPMSIIGKLSTLIKTTGLSGLVNIRNTCYSNSLIQCLRFCPIISEYFLSNQFTTPLNMAFADIIVALWNESIISYKPSKFYEEICKIDNDKKGFGLGRHEDVHEYYVFLIKNLHDEFHDVIPDNDQATDKLKDWSKMCKTYTSFLHRVLHYQIELQSLCLNCNITLIKYDYGNTVFVGCPNDDVPVNLDIVVRACTDTAPDEKPQSKFCLNCEKPMVLKKQISYYPAVLTVNVARYQYCPKEKCMIRKNNPCSFSKIIQFGTQQYTLKSISLHEGTKDVGHYTALCYHPTQNKWYKFNDETCVIANPNDLDYKTKCYLLFYALINDFEEVNKGFFHQ